MAPKKKDEAATETVDLSTKVKPLHKAHSAYIEENLGITVPPEHIFAVYSTRVPFRKTSEQYQESKAAAAQAKEEALAAKEKAKAEKKAEREAAAKAKADAKAAKEAEAAKTEKSTPAKGKAAKAAAPAAPTKGKKKPF